MKLDVSKKRLESVNPFMINMSDITSENVKELTNSELVKLVKKKNKKPK